MYLHVRGLQKAHPVATALQLHTTRVRNVFFFFFFCYRHFRFQLNQLAGGFTLNDLLATFWTSRGHRRLPFSFPVHAFVLSRIGCSISGPTWTSLVKDTTTQPLLLYIGLRNIQIPLRCMPAAKNACVI